MPDTDMNAFISLAPDNRPAPVTAFDHVLKAFLDDFFAAQPVWATQVGFHAFDDRWPDMTQAGRLARLAMLRDHRARLERLALSDLSVDEEIDRGMTVEAIGAMEFEDDVLREPSWDPLSYIALAGSGLFSLLAREYAPWQHRGMAFAGRLRGLVPLLDAAAVALTGVGDRPVSALHTEIALAQIEGITELIDDGIAEAEKRAAAGDAAQCADAIRDAAGPAREAVARFESALREQILPRASGEGRLGEQLFAAKLQHTLASDIKPNDLLDRAQRDYDAVRGEILRLAKEAWPTWLPGQAMPSDADEVARRVFDAIAQVHRKPDELIDFSRHEVDLIEAFCRDRNVIGLADEPMQITWTPVFQRAFGKAFLQAPGFLDKGLSSYFWITPPDESLGPEMTESYMREDNDRMLTLLAIHEGVPGHYLQGAYANRVPSLARGVFGSGVFAEGWAVYVTQVVMDLGYKADDIAMLLTHWKFYLRAAINALIDGSIHTKGMTEEEAVSLMVDGGFQETDEARAKYLRARLTSTQLSTYYLGSVEMWEIEEEARRRAAVAAGAGADAVPAQRIVGGLGQTPGFDYRAHLESVIAHGTPPIKWLRRALFGVTS
ncbi:MAG: DUF885 domain-containing protein [Chloroflexota bacterium]